VWNIGDAFGPGYPSLECPTIVWNIEDASKSCHLALECSVIVWNIGRTC
jgi:hypothetical protein